MKPKKFASVLLIWKVLLSTALVAQPSGGGWAKNVSLLTKTDFGRGASSDVWGWRDTQTGNDYVLVTLNRGLSIVDASNPSNPQEKAHINHINSSDNLRVDDVEVYESGGEAYAYLAVNEFRQYIVLIIKIRQALGDAANIPDKKIRIDPNADPTGSFVGRIPRTVDTVGRAHTLTIAGGILYICPALAVPHFDSTGTSWFDIWDLRASC